MLARALIVSVFCLVGLQSGIASAQLAAYPQSCQKLLRIADQCSDEAIAFERKGGGQKQIVEIEGLRQKIYGSFLLGLTNSGPDDFSRACTTDILKNAVTGPQTKVADAIERGGGSAARCRAALKTIAP